MVVSSETPQIFSMRFLCLLWTIFVKSPPSSNSKFGFQLFGPDNVCSIHHSYSSSVSPFHANTGIFWLAIAAAAWSCVEKMLHEDHLTSAPKSIRVSIRTAV